MNRLLSAFAAAFLCLFADPAAAQSNCGFYFGEVLTAAQWNTCFGTKQDVLGYTPFSSAGGTLTGPLVLSGSTTSQSGLRISPGVAPTVPHNGDVWFVSLGMFEEANSVVSNLLPHGRIVTTGTTDALVWGPGDGNDATVAWNSATSGAKTETLYPCIPAAAFHRITIVDEKGTAGTDHIAVTPNGTDTILGANSAVSISTNFGFYTLQCDGISNWMVVAAG